MILFFFLNFILNLSKLGFFLFLRKEKKTAKWLWLYV